MNFTTRVIEQIEVYIKWNKDRDLMKTIQDNLVSAHKYVVPEPRALRTRVTGNSAKFIRMPFPEVVFEYTVSDAKDTVCVPGINQHLSKSTRRVVLAVDLKRSQTLLATVMRKVLKESDPNLEGLEIGIASFYYVDEFDRWQPSMGFASWGPMWADDFDNDGYNQAIKYGVYALVPELVEGCLKDNLLNPETVYDTMRNDLHEDVGHALRMLALINARNLQTVQVVVAPKALNAKRAKKNRPPFFDYHTLDIFLTGDLPQRRKFLPTADEIRNLFSSGKTALHEVTGHFKERATGIFWWRSFMRGTKDIGVVQSNHNVHKEKT